MFLSFNDHNHRKPCVHSEDFSSASQYRKIPSEKISHNQYKSKQTKAALADRKSLDLPAGLYKMRS